LKTIPTEPYRLRSGPEQEGHTVSGGSSNDWTASRSRPQSRHRYSYVGIVLIYVRR